MTNVLLIDQRVAWRVLGLLFLCLNLFSSLLYAYDDDRSISQVDFNPESFLDINAAAFRPALERDWLLADQGFRISGASISSNRLYLNSALRLRQEFSRNLAVGVSWGQDDFYADKPTPLPQLSINVFPLEDTDLGVAVLGTAAHDKRQADLGYAFLWGREPDDQIRFSWVKVDVFHNEKNEFDDSVYTESGETLSLEGNKKLSSRWRVQFKLERDRPLSLSFDEAASCFEHKRYEHQLATYFDYAADAFVGAKWRIFDITKSRMDSGLNQSQILTYHSLDAFWVTACCDAKELTVGLRYDRFEEVRSDRAMPEEGFRYTLNTTQLYGSVHHAYSATQAWDLGMYAGWSRQMREFAEADAREAQTEGLEAKLRASWALYSQDKHSALRFSLSLNLDDVFNDPGDGGGVYYQTLF